VLAIKKYAIALKVSYTTIRQASTTGTPGTARTLTMFLVDLIVVSLGR
jgi:hypothetical protein